MWELSLTSNGLLVQIVAVSTPKLNNRNFCILLRFFDLDDMSSYGDGVTLDIGKYVDDQCFAAFLLVYPQCCDAGRTRIL